MKFLIPLQRLLWFPRLMIYPQNRSVMEIINQQTVVEIACAHIKSIFQCTPSLKLYWSMKVNAIQLWILYNQRIIEFLNILNIFILSPTTKLEPSIPFTRLLIQRHRYGKITGQECQENQLETRAWSGSKRSIGQAFQFATIKRHDSRTQQWLRSIPIQSWQSR